NAVGGTRACDHAPPAPRVLFDERLRVTAADAVTADGPAVVRVHTGHIREIIERSARRRRAGDDAPAAAHVLLDQHLMRCFCGGVKADSPTIVGPCAGHALEVAAVGATRERGGDERPAA